MNKSIKFSEIESLIDANITNVIYITDIIYDYIDKELSGYLNSIGIILENVTYSESYINTTFDVYFTKDDRYYSEEIHSFFDKFVDDVKLRTYTINTIIQ